jgi:hypothetical protein
MVRTGIVLVMSLAFSALFGSAIALERGSNLNAATKLTSSRSDLLQTVQEQSCPAGYPSLRNSTNTCYSSEADCRDTNGGGWACHQVNSC